jgi:hypothetical protein
MSNDLIRPVEGDLIDAPRAPAARPIIPRGGLRIREGTMDDLPFIDALQKAHTREVGFLPRMALEGKIKAGQVLIAEQANGERAKAKETDPGSASFALPLSPFSALGYLIAADRYFKRDEVGYITQINVVPEHRRSLVAAALLQAQFDRSAYGCRLYCCWCAQDLAASAFWESMGFAPIAFRTGSRVKGKKSGGGRAPRIHVFWQKRIREGDDGPGATPWWYPSQTGGGEMREDRLVFPIPPGVSWRDVLPVVLPGTQERQSAPVPAKRKAKGIEIPIVRVVTKPRGPRTPGGLWFEHDLIQVVEQKVKGGWRTVAPLDTPLGQSLLKKAEEARAAEEKEAAAAPPKKLAIDPRLTALARELRDRWTEQVQAGRILAAPAAKHDVRRLAEPAPPPEVRALPEAA